MRAIRLGEKARKLPEDEAKQLQEKAEKIEREAKKIEREVRKLKEEPPYTPPPISRSQIPLKRAKDLYSPEIINKIIDNHVMLALHPPLVNILFPTNGFMLEVDPEEPEIGFLSRRASLSNCQTLEENLRVDARLREKLWIYRCRENKEDIRRREFVEKKTEDKGDSQEEDILILSRTENLFRILIAENPYGRMYHPMRTVLKLIVLVLLIILARSILKTPSFDKALSKLLWDFVILFAAIFIFWALKTFVLNYLLEPMYDILKWVSYVFLLFMLCRNVESLDILIASFSFVVLASVIIIFNCYIYSAILHSLNESLGIIGYNDHLKTDPLLIKFKEETMDLETKHLTTGKNEEAVGVLRCGQFHSVIRKDNNVYVLFNSKLFPKIKYILKKTRTFPRDMAYSSGILLYPKKRGEEEDKEKSTVDAKEKSKEALLYRKPRTWRFWGTIKSFLLGKGEIECTNGPDDRFSPHNRFIYFGEWNYVMKHIGTAIPVFPESILFRNMIILAVLSGLVFNIFPENGVHLEDFVAWIVNMGLWKIILYLVIPFIWILVATELKVWFWRILLVLVFYYLLLFQPFSIVFSIIILILFILFAVLLFFQFQFPIIQVWYSLKIWWDERINGTIISVTNGDGERGTRIKRNPMVTRLFMNKDCVEEERIYFNERFFKEIVCGNWDMHRENQ